MKIRKLRSPKFTKFTSTYGALSGVHRRGKAAPKAKKRSRAKSSTLAGPYVPVSEGLNTLTSAGAGLSVPVLVPDSMDSETNSALRKLRDALGGDVSLFVQERLGYRSHEELAQALVAEQVDAVALAIYNIEVRGEGLIIADQTGIGKGRIGAALIRYGSQRGLFPIFLSERPNLFSDIYRDLTDIGSGNLRPFIVNAREGKSDVKASDGSILYQALPAAEQRALINSVAEPTPGGEPRQNRIHSFGDKKGEFDCVLATYSQFNQGFDWTANTMVKRGGQPVKREFSALNAKCRFLANLAKGNLLILDESHNASGESNTGEFMGQVLGLAQGVGFLSATYAKRPDNMVVYAKKTVMQEAGLSSRELVAAVNRGGVALQEIISSQLVSGGQLLRRERPYEGVEVNWIALTEQAAVHRARSDEMMAILRDIIEFQTKFVDPYIKNLNQSLVSSQVSKRAGTNQGGISNTPAFSRVFNLIYQLLFGIKAEAVAAHAIYRMQQGENVIITFQSTMGAFVEGLRDEEEAADTGTADEGETGLSMQVDTQVQATFEVVLRRVLQMTLSLTEKDSTGKSTKRFLSIDSLDMEAKLVYTQLLTRIGEVSTDVNISPIDLIAKIIKRAGFGVAEVTGRQLYLDLSENNRTGYVRRRTRENTTDAFRRFNNNEVQCMLLNAAGSTGASAHAVATKKVPAAQVRPRRMLVHQMSLDINVEVQKRGRIFRTGMLLAPGYDYLMSLIPAEMRLMMMGQRKLKSLDANTTSNQKQSSKLVETDGFVDFLNHHGDRIVAEYLLENRKLNKQLGDPLKSCEVTEPEDGSEPELKTAPADFASKVAGRMAIMSTAQQSEFYTEVTARYRDHLAYLNETGQNDLEVKDLDLRAVSTARDITLAGQGGRSQFGGSVYREQMTVRNLTKPLTADELLTIVRDTLAGRSAMQVQNAQYEQVKAYFKARREGWMSQFNWDEAIGKEVARRRTPKNLHKDDPEKYAALIALIREDIQEKLDSDLVNLGRAEDLMGNLIFMFKIGHGYLVPNPDYLGHSERDHYIAATFLGLKIDERRSNPYAKSAVQLQFALASPHRTVTLPLSSTLGKLTYFAANEITLGQPWSGMVTASTWTSLISQESADTESRYMLTGNVLLALGSSEFKEFRLPLVSFTMADGTVRKGIFMPREYNRLVQRMARAGGNNVAQSLRASGLAARLSEIFMREVELGKSPSFSLGAAGGSVTLLVRKNPDSYYEAKFDLFLGWKDKIYEQLGKSFVKNEELLLALSARHELAKTPSKDAANDRRFKSVGVPIDRLRQVLLTLGKAGVMVMLTEKLLADYPDLLPENRDFDNQTWPLPPDLPKPRKVKPTAPGAAVVATPPAGLELARAKLKLAALALALARVRQPQLAGLKGRRGAGRPSKRIAHPRIKSLL